MSESDEKLLGRMLKGDQEPSRPCTGGGRVPCTVSPCI